MSLWSGWLGSQACGPQLLNPSVFIVGQNFSTQVAWLTSVWISLNCRTVLCIVGSLAVALGFIHQMSVAPAPLVMTKHLQRCQIPPGTNMPQLGANGLKILSVGFVGDHILNWLTPHPVLLPPSSSRVSLGSLSSISYGQANPPLKFCFQGPTQDMHVWCKEKESPGENK